MADNITLDAGAGGAVLATDEIDSKHYQKTLAGWGVDGTWKRVTAAAGLPVAPEAGATWAITNDNTVDTGNSTTAPLGISAVFTGTGVDCLGYSTVTVALKADQDSAVDGMLFEFSPDNANWDDSNTFTFALTDGSRRFQFPVTARYFRVKFTNGATGQNVFRLQTILHRQNTLTSIHRLVDDISPDRSAQLVKAIVAAQSAGTGDYMAVQATAGGNFKVSVEEVNGAEMPVKGTVLHDAADTGDAPLKIGGVATTSQPAAVANSDLVNAYFDSTGHQHVKVDNTVTVNSHAVTNAGTFAVQEDGAALTALQLIDDTVAVLGTATYTETGTKGNVVGAVRNDDLASLADTDNELAPLQVNSAGALYTEPAQQVDYVFDGAVKTEIKRATGIAASGTTVMVAAVPGRKIRVLAIQLIATAATVTNVYIANADNNIIGSAANPIPLSQDADGDNIAGFVMPWNPGGWFETDAVNENLNLVLSAALDVIYALTYLEVA